MREFLSVLLIFCGIIITTNLFAQNTPDPAPTHVIDQVYKPTHFDEQVNLAGPDGRSFKSDISDREGTPYYFNDFRFANIILMDGKVFDSILIKYDIEKNELHYLPSGKKEIILKDGLVKDFLFSKYTSNNLPGEKFRSAYPPIDKNTFNSYYQVLSDGRLQLLRFSKKEFNQTKNIMSGEIKKEFVQNDFYYVYKNGDIVKLKKDKAWFFLLMQDHSEKIKSTLKI